MIRCNLKFQKLNISCKFIWDSILLLKNLNMETWFHLQTLRQQLSMLMLGHLSPIVIDPENLRELLMEISAK